MEICTYNGGIKDGRINELARQVCCHSQQYMMLRVVLRVRRMTIGVRRSDLGRERLALISR